MSEHGFPFPDMEVGRIRNLLIVKELRVKREVPMSLWITQALESLAAARYTITGSRLTGI